VKIGQVFPAKWLTKKTSIEQIEQNIELLGSSVEDEWLKEWQVFKAAYQPDCEVWNFVDECHWAFGFTGYALIRDGRLVASIGGIRENKKEPNQ